MSAQLAMTVSIFICGYASGGGRRQPLAEVSEANSPAAILALKNAVSGFIPAGSALYETDESKIEFSLRAFGAGEDGRSKKSENAVEQAVFAADFGKAIAGRNGGRISMELLAVYFKNGGLLAAEYRERTGELRMLHSIQAGLGQGKESHFISSPLSGAIKSGSIEVADYAEYTAGRKSDGAGGRQKGSLIALIPQRQTGGAIILRLDYKAKGDPCAAALARFVFAGALAAAGVEAEELKTEFSLIDSAAAIKLASEARQSAEGHTEVGGGAENAEGDSRGGEAQSQESDDES